MTITRNRIVVKTSEDSTIVRSRKLPLEIGIVLDTPSGKPGELTYVSSIAELERYFGESSTDYPIYEIVRTFLRSFYGVSVVKVPVTGGTYSTATVKNASDENIITLKGVSKSDYEDGFGITFKQIGGNLSAQLVRYTSSQGQGSVMEVLSGLPTSDLDALVAEINNKSRFIIAEKIGEAEGPVELDEEFVFAGGARGTVIDEEDIKDCLNAFNSPNVARMDYILAPGLYTSDTVVSKAMEIADARYETSAIVDFFDPSKKVTPSDVMSQVATYPMSNKVRYYYPDVGIKSALGPTMTIPASLAVLFVYARASLVNPWTAPAGYDRNFAIPGASYLTHTLSAEDESALYEGTADRSAVNPIIYDSTSGFIVNGIRTGAAPGVYTRSATASAMSNYLHYEINAISKMYQYKPNTESSWDGWLLEVNSLLDNIQTGGGIDAYEAFMGVDTMTEEDIRGGILKGIVRVLPTSAIEYIEIQVALTNVEATAAGSEL